MFFARKIKPVIISVIIFAISILLTTGSTTDIVPSNNARHDIQAVSIDNDNDDIINLDKLHTYRLFPAMLDPNFVQSVYRHAKVYGPSKTWHEHKLDIEKIINQRQPILANNQIIAFYGKPSAPSMGILGEYTKEQIAPLLEAYAKLYDNSNGALGVVPAFYIIYGTCWPGGEIGILSNDTTIEYIEFAQKKGWQVFLDHQIGKYDVVDSVKKMLPFLKYPNVHLAIDPEWRTTLPMKEIGYITGDELNACQELVNKYLQENNLPLIRMFVVHQFTSGMIREASKIKANYDRVILVHNADGFGSPNLKRYSYASNSKITNMPVKGFKLFFQSKVPGAGSDIPLMKPEDVLELEPMPLLIMYQ